MLDAPLESSAKPGGLRVPLSVAACFLGGVCCVADGGSTGSTGLRGGGSKGSVSFHPATDWDSCRFGLATGALLGGILRINRSLNTANNDH